jgi:cytochrome c oxidase assembly protein subunit 11
MRRQHPSNRRTAMRLTLVAAGMFGFGYLLVPLYDVLCEITGFNGRTGDAVAEERLDRVVDTERLVTVEFITSVNGLRWEFRPTVKRMQVHPGQIYETNFYARNMQRGVATGQAVPSVSPTIAAPHFSKTECFCFTKQRFEAGEERDMPLRFVLRTDLPPDVETVTLSYTFFNTGEDA